MNVLDLPIDEQLALAKSEGLSHAAWAEQVKREMAESRAFVKKIIAEGKSSTMSKEAIANMQAKFDSANPPG